MLFLFGRKRPTFVEEVSTPYLNRFHTGLEGLNPSFHRWRGELLGGIYFYLLLILTQAFKGRAWDFTKVESRSSVGEEEECSEGKNLASLGQEFT
jgi:hypothetical protein